ncbi:FHA domain-containing protein [Massilia cavernae]|nr:FHA domain-containing protein [Massilia cavernae]
MKKCGNPEHPYCTQWVLPGELACSSGHAQPAPAPAPVELPQHAAPRSHLHISGFDPRAAGGRQAIKVELRGMPSGAQAAVTMELKSALFEGGASRHAYERNLHGGWRPQFVEFNARGKEHGQYRIEAELHCSEAGRVARRWVCTLIVLVPRPDASLGEIHNAFLATHKNVRISADDASIARISAQAGGGSFDIGVDARNGSIARLDLDARSGQVTVGYSSIAWDEDLIEIEVPAEPAHHPHPGIAGCLSNAPGGTLPRHMRIFALRECVLGRFESLDPEADVLLRHYGQEGPEEGGLTRRLSARHAVIRHTGAGFEIEDVSRYGLLLDGAPPGKHQPVQLRLGMTIELSASIRGIVMLKVGALPPGGVILLRTDGGAHDECFYIVEPEHHPGLLLTGHPALPAAASLPVVFHHNGGLWRVDAASGQQSAIDAGHCLNVR